MSKILALLGLLAVLVAPAPVLAQSANSLVGWQCKTTTPVGWCPTSAANPMPVTLVSGSSPGNVNLAQVAGATTAVGNGTTDTGTQRVTISSDSTGQVIALGNVASGATDSGNPVKIGCLYLTSVPAPTNGQRQDCLVGAGGELIAGPRITGSTVLSDGNSNSVSLIQGTTSTGTTNSATNRGYPLNFNGANWDRQFTCPSTAVVNVTAGNTTQIVALAASQVIRVCSIGVSMSAAGTAQFVYGTGSNCGAGTTSITGAMPLATGTPLTISSGNGSVMRTASANALCVAAVTGNVVGFVTYAQY